MPALSPTDGLPKLDKEQQQYLLQLALRSINAAIAGNSALPDDRRNDPVFNEPGACFVTLEKHQNLRGCIGSLNARRALIDDVWHNAQAAAFHDPRFPPLTRDELPEVMISLSILGQSQPLTIKNETDLLQQLIPHEHGVIIECDYHRATFLPQVWTHFNDKEDFLIALRQKAGLPSSFDSAQKYWVYRCLCVKNLE